MESTPPPARATAPAALDDKPPPFLERWGIRALRKMRSASGAPAGADAVHVLNAGERAALRAIERSAITRSAIAGAVSAALIAAVEVLMPVFGLPDRPEGLGEHAAYWAVLGGVSAVVSAIEIYYLYRLALRSVHDLALAAGLDVAGSDPEGRSRAVAAALARAALELPDPPEHVYGIDPHREAQKWRLVLSALAYKLKVSVSSFVAKLVVRRIGGRALARTWLPFVAVPVTAFWDAAVTWWVLRKARIRAMGPSAAEQYVGEVLAGSPQLSEAGRRAAFQAVAAVVVRTYGLHPNVKALLQALARRVEVPEDDDRGLPAAFLALLPTLSPEEQRVAVRLVALAAVIDGRTTRKEADLVSAARAACGLPPDPERLRTLRRDFLAGRDLDP